MIYLTIIDIQKRYHSASIGTISAILQIPL